MLPLYATFLEIHLQTFNILAKQEQQRDRVLITEVPCSNSQNLSLGRSLFHSEGEKAFKKGHSSSGFQMNLNPGDFYRPSLITGLVHWVQWRGVPIT